VTPTGATDERTVWRSLALEDPQHPPLYFWATSLLERVTGDSVFFRRLPAVLFALLALPAVWWLAYELFGEALVAWCVTALVAVSPFHVEFAQQAREYSLWTLTTALSSALLLRSLRGGGVWNWIGYAVSLALGMWSFSLFAQVVVAQALYATLFSAASTRRKLYALVACAAGVATFGPWMRVMAGGARVAIADTSWQATHLSAPLYAGKWIFNAGTVFFDLDYLSLMFVPVTLALLAFAAWSLYVLVRTAPARVWGFVLLLAAVSVISFLAPDLIMHQTRAVEARYLTPLWLALELATGFALVTGLTALGKAALLGARIATAGIFAAGIVSCGVAAYARTWWIASSDQTMPAIASALARQPEATLVYVGSDDMLLELQPVARRDLSFVYHPDIDAAALKSATFPYVIGRPNDVAGSRIAARLRPVTLPALFPHSQDSTILQLHQHAGADRNAGIYQHDLLYADALAGHLAGI
jgi:uncharacterized membrane protein